jgi:hypothetical protein
MDNHHVYISDSRASCGILELSDFKSDSRKVLYALANHLYHPARGTPASFVMWSDIILETGLSNGGQLFKTIEDTFGGIGGGGLLGSDVVENPKTSNEIQVYLWTIPHEKFREWYKQERVRRAQRI